MQTVAHSLPDLARPALSSFHTFFPPCSPSSSHNHFCQVLRRNRLFLTSRPLHMQPSLLGTFFLWQLNAHLKFEALHG